jgi:hypothetical protein
MNLTASPPHWTRFDQAAPITNLESPSRATQATLHPAISFRSVPPTKATAQAGCTKFLGRRLVRGNFCISFSLTASEAKNLLIITHPAFTTY